MKLLYFRGNHPNFGDDLNALLWPKLAPRLFASPGDAGFLGIGTVIGMAGIDSDRLHVFSSGAGYLTVDRRMIARCRFWCVRGPMTAEMLGLDPDIALTDGAILTPGILPPPKRRPDVVVVPHWETILAEKSRNRWATACDLAGMTLVTPIQAPELAIPRIAGASLVLTESLHGAIIADTYGVPWIAFATSANFSVFKWLDWTRSVGVKLRVHAVRPPDTALLLRFGRPPVGRWGACGEPDDAAAMADFRGRNESGGGHAQGAAARLRSTMKRRVDRSPQLQALLGYSAVRTADALMDLANEEPSLSDERLRKRLAERMTERLDRLIREQQVAQPALIR
jgi:succinoglycan biosynthesis protein ExoV